MPQTAEVYLVGNRPNGSDMLTRTALRLPRQVPPAGDPVPFIGNVSARRGHSTLKGAAA